MPLVHMEDLGLRVTGQLAVGPHRPDSADAEEQFLAQPVLGPAAVEPVGDTAQLGIVGLVTGVEQQ